ncbi:MAG: FtsX-like permease family protein [Candidatus Omnitrophota bacterium]|jgi:putative ABC transport system permease protein|nr:MAG: FtsX-like permease family protein [Candidatus Omnitrophota bacterium]
MLIWIILKISLKSLFVNKLRTFLATLGIVIGVSAVITMMGIGTGARNQIMSQINSMGTNLLVVRPARSRGQGVMSGSRQTLTVDDAEKILKRIANVEKIAPVINTRAQVKYLNNNADTTVTGACRTYFSIRNFQIDKGRSFTDGESERNARVAILGPQTVENLFDDADADCLGETIKVKGINFRIIGVLKSKGDQGWFNPDDQIIVPYTTAMNRIAGVDYLSEIDIQVIDENQIDATELATEKLLRKLHRLQEDKENDFNIQNQAEMLETASTILGTFTLLLSGIAGISLLVGGIGIMNIMLVTVTERIREIGIRKSIGAKNRDILQQFLIEAILMSGLGGLIGIFLGINFLEMIDRFTELSTAIETYSIVLSFAISATVGIFFGYYPARRAAKMDPIEALRYE